jgi:hypothetical protein
VKVVVGAKWSSGTLKVVIGAKWSSTTFASPADQVYPQQNTNLEIGGNPSDHTSSRPSRNVVDHLPTHFHLSSGPKWSSTTFASAADQV